MLDWEEYDMRIDPDFEGGAYFYQAADVGEDFLEMLWDKVEEHYSRPLDFEWSMYSISAIFVVLTQYAVSRWVDVEPPVVSTSTIYDSTWNAD